MSGPYVCIEQELKNLIWSSWRVKSEWKNLNFWYLETMGGLNLGQKWSLKMAPKVWGAYKNYILADISFIITNLCKQCVLCGQCDMSFLYI